MTLTKAQREAVRMMYGGHCAYCGVQLSKRWHADHVEPVGRITRWVSASSTNGWKPGHYEPTGEMEHPERDVITNIKPACHHCNIDKSNFPLERWRAHLQDGCARLHRNYSTYRHSLRMGLIIEVKGPILFYFEKMEAQRRIPRRLPTWGKA